MALSKIKSKDKKLKILLLSPEVAPYTKVGGLADVAWALPRALRQMGHDVRVFTPKFRQIEEKFKLQTVLSNLELRGDDQAKISCNVKQGKIPGDIIVYLLENQEYYEKRANVYGYADDPRRWMILSLGALEFIRKSSWIPDVIHTNDWMTGFVPNYLTTIYKDDPKLNKISTLYSIHNVEFQGQFNYRTVAEADKDDGFGPLPEVMSDRTLKLNVSRRAILYSDIVTTVSETYAQEILTPEYGAGLDRLLREMRTKLFGVLNGMDNKVFDPATDPDIWQNYDKDSLELKVKNKLAFQKEFGLTQDADVPMLGFVGRLSQQKGLDLILEALEKLLPVMDFQFVVVGAEDAKYERAFHDLMKKYPKRVGGHLMISKIIGQQIYAASDIFLYPSKYEPCGLAQLIAMRYGSIPVVRKTGGLADTVFPYDPNNEDGTGFVFEQYDPTTLIIQIVRALEVYRHKKVWNNLVKRAMEQDFSWDASAKKYVDLYRKAIARRQLWLKKEGIVMPEAPTEVPGITATTKEPLR